MQSTSEILASPAGKLRVFAVIGSNDVWILNDAVVGYHQAAHDPLYDASSYRFLSVSPVDSGPYFLGDQVFNLPNPSPFKHYNGGPSAMSAYYIPSQLGLVCQSCEPEDTLLIMLYGHGWRNKKNTAPYFYLDGPDIDEEDGTGHNQWFVLTQESFPQSWSDEMRARVTTAFDRAPFSPRLKLHLHKPLGELVDTVLKGPKLTWASHANTLSMASRYRMGKLAPKEHGVLHRILGGRAILRDTFFIVAVNIGFESAAIESMAEDPLMCKNMGKWDVDVMAASKAGIKAQALLRRATRKFSLHLVHYTDPLVWLLRLWAVSGCTKVEAKCWEEAVEKGLSETKAAWSGKS
ncbi:hypothetical protein BDP27DRAFT_1414870 [Rhodocollybia butyracea]|uniref:Uncharacterized protein n=1 Tax=Rhodocollybia butyracea TaxID=206335 RepID=A0A9P5Q6S9_9AGAR|nr:hypothetical protein BDP27DRAFT_1414870 [Rhodocollybia butyracea]